MSMCTDPRLERPQLFLDENDDPIVLYSACSITPLNQKKDGSSFNIQIPVLCSSGNPVTRFPRCNRGFEKNRTIVLPYPAL